MSAWEHDGYDRERDQERDDLHEETADEWVEAEKFDRMFRTRDYGPGEEE